jgi:hypothetical protein
MTMPNFFIVGAQKSGTTSLYYYLQQHPQIYMSRIKEPDFFSSRDDEQYPDEPDADRPTLVNDIDTYRSLFRDVSGETAIGEASTSYLCVPSAPERIRCHVPDARLIVILRDPAERTYSSFLHSLRWGYETQRDFAQALQREKSAVDEGGLLASYKQRGFYYPQVKRYFDTFGRDKVQVYLFEDLNADPDNVLRDVFEFLGVDTTFTPNTSLKHNIGGIPRNEPLHRSVVWLWQNMPAVGALFPSGFRRVVKGRLLAETPSLLPEVRRRLVEEYREDILNLQDLIQRDLSRWLEA